ncbi:MAG: AAA family ATPase [Clostridia bacterium]|nr:AAA family ATPase [Clostridia bacterium]
MYIKKLHIDAFGGIRGLTLELDRGLNIIEGKNESGKSSVAMFIKFIFYGLSGRGLDGAVSERKKYVNWETGSAAGYLLLYKDGVTYKISRELYVSDAGERGGEAVRERVNIVNEETGEKMFRGEVPGMALLSMPEQMFYNSFFVRQLSDAAIDGEGMSEAIENILYSGDEEISTRRALDKLDKARKALLHKNGNGGKIYDLRREKMRLEAELQGAKEKNDEIIDLESAVADSGALIEKRLRHAKELEEIVDCREKFEKQRTLNDMESLEAEQHRLKLLLETYAPKEEIEAACEEIRSVSLKRSEAELKLRNVKMRIAALDKSLPPLMSDEEKAELRFDVTQARRAAGKKKSSFVFSVILFILMVICGCAALLLWKVDFNLAVIAAAATGVMLILGAVLLTVSISSLKKLNRLLDKWRAAEPDNLEAIVNDKIETSDRMRSDTSEFGILAKESIELENEREAIVNELRTLSGRFAEENPDTDTMTEAALSAAADTLKEIAQYTREFDTVSGKLSMFGKKSDEERQQIRGDAEAALATEVGKKAYSLNQAEYDKVLRDKGFFASTAEAQRRRHYELEKKLGALTAVAQSPAELAAKLDAVDRELLEATENYKGLVLAFESITRAGENLRASLLPRIVAEAGALLGEFTAGKYTGIGVDRNFKMSYSPSGYVREADFMSAGTRDAAYISLRSALMKVLFHKDTPMAIYDESFARIDEERLERLLSILVSAGEDGMQSLVFTCRSLEGHIAGDSVPVIKI